MSSELKVLLIIIGVIGFGLMLAGGIVSHYMPNDHGRGDIVYSEVSRCLTSIGMIMMMADIFFVVAYLVRDMEFLVKLFCIIGILMILLSVIISPIVAKNAIQEYDRLYGGLVTIYQYFI